MISKIIKFVFMKWVYPVAKEYVDSTDNDYDNKALDFLVEVVDLLCSKLDKWLSLP